MRRVAVRFAGGVCALALLGCGGRSTSTSAGGVSGSGHQGATGNEGGSSNVGATGNMGATSSLGASSGIAGTSSGVGGGAPSPGKCAAFDDETSWPMLIRFSNQTQRTIHL